MANDETHGQTVKRWEGYAQGLVGKRVIGARYLSDEEARGMGWCGQSLVLIFEGGIMAFASQDDEGNGPGSLFLQGYKVAGKDLDQFPVIR